MMHEKSSRALREAARVLRALSDAGFRQYEFGYKGGGTAWYELDELASELERLSVELVPQVSSLNPACEVSL